MRKLIFLLLALALLSGCITLQQTLFTSTKVPQESTSGYISQEIIFPKEGDQLQSSLPFHPTVRLTNSGPFESDGQVCISGLDSSAFRGFSGCECNTFNMQKEERTFLPENVDFGAYSILNEEPQDYTITSITRYKYKSVAKVKMCVKDNADEMALCSSELLSTKDGPLRITSVEQASVPISDSEVALSFSINVEKRAEGDVWDVNAVQERCRPEREIRRNVRVKINGLPFGSGQCGEKLFDKDEANIKCPIGEISLEGRSFGENYNPEIEVELDYAFETRASNRFSVQ